MFDIKCFLPVGANGRSPILYIIHFIVGEMPLAPTKIIVFTRRGGVPPPISFYRRILFPYGRTSFHQYHPAGYDGVPGSQLIYIYSRTNLFSLIIRTVPFDS